MTDVGRLRRRADSAAAFIASILGDPCPKSLARAVRRHDKAVEEISALTNDTNILDTKLAIKEISQ